MRLMRVLFAAFVAISFGCMPTLSLAAAPAESPPFVALAAEAPVVAEALDTNMCSPLSAAGKIALTDLRSSTVLEAPAYPLLE